MFIAKPFWLCNVLGHKFQKVKDLRIASLQRERVVYRCARCNCPMVIREKDRRRNDRRQSDRRQDRYLSSLTLKYNV